MVAMTYGRLRLWIGISGVGFLVVAAAGLLWWGIPHVALPLYRQPLAADLFWLALILLAYTMLHWPFDWVGGYLLPCRFGRLCHLLPAFVWACIRGTWVQMGTMLLCAGLTLAAGRAGGRLAATATVLALMIVLLAWQERWAQAVGGLHEYQADLEPVAERLRSWGLKMPPVRVLAGMDPGFSGGIVGLPGRERIILPAQWLQTLDVDLVAIEVARRAGAIETGSRMRGLAVALAWNTGGYWLASGMPGAGFATLADYLTLVLWFTLWSFIGLLILPSVSRPGVLELDTYVREKGVPTEAFEKAVSELDQLQDDEPIRPKLVESIFHPIPSVENRKRAWRQGRRSWGAWHAARMALFLSWPALGLLGRAVHCNSGRPELWVLLPAD